MRKYIIILLVLILIFTSSCTKKENEETKLPIDNASNEEDELKQEDGNIKDKVEEVNSISEDENIESDDWLIEVYKGIYIVDGDDIYYITDDYDELYSIKKDGSNKTLIYEQERMFQVQIYNDKLYVYYSVYTSISGPSSPVIPGKIVTMNKDGSDVTELDLGIEYTKVYYPGGFFIYKDFLVLTVENLDAPYDGMNNLRDYYLYNLKNDKLVDVVKEIDMVYSPIIHNDILYYNGYGNFDEDSKGNTLHKHNINTGEKSKIEICKTPDSLNWFYKFQIKDNFIYSMNKYGVYKDNLDGKSDTEILFKLEDENKFIVDLNITDKYIFYIIKDDNIIENDKDSLKIIVYRMNHDGTNIKEIYSETQFATNMAPQKVRASRIDDTILIYANHHTNTILYMDLDGNIINITNLANLKAANLGYSTNDGDYIYYLAFPFDKLYRIKKDGSKRTLIYENERMYNIQIYDNKMYVYSSGILDGRIFGKIITMNKDGTYVEILEPDFGYPSGYYISEFFIHNDYLFILSYDLSIAEEGDPNDLFKYNLKNGNFTKVSDVKIRSGGYTVEDEILYYYDYNYQNEKVEHSTLYKYNINTDEITSIIINKNDYKERWISYLLIKDDYAYYKGKTFINRDKLDGKSDTETIFGNEEFLIISMAITDDYIFFINMESPSQVNIDNYTMDLTINRMKHDGSEFKTIFTETMSGTNLPSKAVMVILEDNILKYRNRIARTFKTMDFDGNILK